MESRPFFKMLTTFLFVLFASKVAAAQGSATGVLLMAHGGGKDWNEKVRAVAAEVERIMPIEVAFGMADRSTLQAAIDKLSARGVKQVVAVPLFVSSHSSVIESTKYLLGLRPDAPKELAYFANMSHDMAAMTATAIGTTPAAETPRPPAPQPVKSSVLVRMTPALDHHAIVAQILSDRIASIAKNPERDVVVLVAHGPNDDFENAQWLADMSSLAKQIGTRTSYAHIDCVTLRDDTEPAVRNAATAELRKIVQAAGEAGHHALVVPLLLSYGGIENGLRQRLDGIEHTLAAQGLLPDPRIAQWVIESVKASQP